MTSEPAPVSGLGPGHAFSTTMKDGVCIVSFDVPDSPSNAFTFPIMDEFDTVLDHVAARTDVRGAVFVSGRRGQYHIGANLDALAATNLDAAWAERFAGRGQQLLTRLATLPWPTVAAIDGEILGGGAEFALALDGRVATSDSRIRFGFPETTLGLMPCWGGTQRLPRLVGLEHAVTLITTGQTIAVERAEAIGLVSRVVGDDDLLSEACAWVTRHSDSGDGVHQWRERRQMTLRPIEPLVEPPANPSNPAVAAAARAMYEGGAMTLEDGLLVERRLFVDLVSAGVSMRTIRMAAMARRLAALADPDG